MKIAFGISIIAFILFNVALIVCKAFFDNMTPEERYIWSLGGFHINDTLDWSVGFLLFSMGVMLIAAITGIIFWMI